MQVDFFLTHGYTRPHTTCVSTCETCVTVYVGIGVDLSDSLFHLSLYQCLLLWHCLSTCVVKFACWTCNASVKLLTADCISLIRTICTLWFSVAAPPSRQALSVLTGKVSGRTSLLCCGNERNVYCDKPAKKKSCS